MFKQKKWTIEFQMLSTMERRGFIKRKEAKPKTEQILSGKRKTK